MDRPNNITPLHTATYTNLNNTNLNKAQSFLINLMEEHILNNISASLIDIQKRLLKLSSQATNNNQELLLSEVRLLLKERTTFIEKSFKKNLEDISQEKKEGPLQLLENKDLERQIITHNASKALTDSRSLSLLEVISNRLKYHHNLYQLICPVHICSCFEKTISDLSLSTEMEDICLQAFSHSMQPHIVTLYENADKFLENSGFPILATAAKDEIKAYGDEINENKLLDNLTNKVIEKSRYGLANQNMYSDNNSPLLTPADLEITLSIIQVELLTKLDSIEDLSESIKTSLEHQGVHQKLSRRHQDLINLVGMLFEFILDDHQLHNDIRKLIALLQIPLLKLAIFDTTFLSDRHHPARDLLNEMIAAGMAYSGETLQDKTLMQLIDHTVRMIISYANDDNIFTLSLDRFRNELKALNTASNKPLPHRASPEVTVFKAQDDKSKNLLGKVQPPAEDTSTLTMISDTNHTLEEIILESGTRKLEPFPLPDSDEINIKTFQPVAGLAENQWVEFIGESDKSLRCKLSDIDTLHNRYTFINSSGMKVTEKSSEELQADFEKGTLKILDDSPLFDRALQNVINKFLRY